MWQRIQTLFLLLAIAMNAILFGVDLAKLTWEEAIYSFTLSGMLTSNAEMVYTSTTLSVVCTFSILLSLIVIGMYKKRQLQIKLSQLNLFIQVILIALIFFLIDEGASSLGETDGVQIEYVFGTFISLIPLLFIYLAIRGIKKDEALIRAADRIR